MNETHSSTKVGQYGSQSPSPLVVSYAINDFFTNDSITLKTTSPFGNHAHNDNRNTLHVTAHLSLTLEEQIVNKCVTMVTEMTHPLII